MEMVREHIKYAAIFVDPGDEFIDSVMPEIEILPDPVPDLERTWETEFRELQDELAWKRSHGVLAKKGGTDGAGMADLLGAEPPAELGRHPHLGPGPPVDAEPGFAFALQLQGWGCHNVNFVTPEHVVPQVVEAVRDAHGRAVLGGLLMLLLMLLSSYLRKRGRFSVESESGITFWSAMYIPIIVAMAATLNVKAAFSGGWTALLAGAAATLAGFLLVPVLTRLGAKGDTHDNQEP